jgi:membrane protein
MVNPVTIVRRTFAAFLAHDVLTLAAALAFYTLLSFAPLMIMIMWSTAALGSGVQTALLGEFASLAGDDARLAALAVIEGIKQRPQLGSVASLIGIGVVLIGATSVFAQLQASLNFIWDVKPHTANAVWGWLRRRILSAGVLLAIGFVLTVSTLISSALGLFLARSGSALEIVNESVATVIFSGLFAALFRYLPDARLKWRHAWGGGVATAILFGAGKWAISVYLTRGDVGAAYGAAGSLVVLLVWTYYSAVVFFFSAELLQACLAECGQTIEPLDTGRARELAEGTAAPEHLGMGIESHGHRPQASETH